MEDSCGATFHDFHLASRKADEAAWRRFQAVEWLEVMVGPLGLPPKPTEKYLLACLRNGLVLCNVINRIHPGAVPKVVEYHSPRSTFETVPLQAYQYFENVRNFLVAIEELGLPGFETCDLEKDALDANASCRIVDCILALRSYHEWNCSEGISGSWKFARSPLVSHSGSKVQGHGPLSTPLNSRRHLDLSNALSERGFTSETVENTLKNLRDDGNALSDELGDDLFDEKENIDQNILADITKGEKMLKQRSSANKLHHKCKLLLDLQEMDLKGIKTLLSGIKEDFKVLQSQMGKDFKKLECQVGRVTFSASGYSNILKENRTLYNTLQDLRGNIRVYCRIRPACAATHSTIDFIEEDGSLLVVDPLKADQDIPKMFQFSKIFGPSSSQEEIFKNVQPLIRSVMDGYNVCIFAYGQTGSGKTHTMYGPSSSSLKDKGINYLALDDLFKLSHDRKDVIKYEVQVQMVEIYNEKVRDLLAFESSEGKYPEKPFCSIAFVMLYLVKILKFIR